MTRCPGLPTLPLLLPVSALLRALRAEATFEGAAKRLLEALAVEVGGLEPLRAAQLARGLVHLRPAGAGYRALSHVEWIAGHGGQVAPSATVFGLVEQRRRAVAVDLATSTGVDLETGEPMVVPAAYIRDAGSRQRMLAREVTHLLALPLIAPADGAVAGMVSLELSWPERLGQKWPPGAWSEGLRELVEVASAVVLSRPVSPSDGAQPVDPLLPVLGARTRPLLRVLEVFVGLDETLLITGPTGAGKSRLAAWCHARSPRHKKPLVTANLIAVPESMQLAELFGWRRGAFTGASDDHVGLVEAADGGTLFLDEIDKLSLGAQAALLRLLETRRFAPLGTSRERNADVRFVVGTNADLPALVRSRAFREDLYYRINVLPVHLPPLAERRDEIAGWAAFMLARRHEDAGGSGAVAFQPAATELLAEQPWPGNLRQLENVVRRVYALWLAAADGAETIDAALVRSALAVEGGGEVTSEGGALGALARTAELLVDEALARRERGEATVALTELDALRAAVLRSAVSRTGSAKDAYLLFGGEAIVRSRNHGKELKRELEALEALEAALRRRG